ncbi:hypothetical protein FAUST_9594 [Fusarium austroamericanum]|uniref:Helicase C-terminal domain-containing protein n=1 Tax=Fusarium austroamericanum TaxID=282268 RepID=A0AAN5Z2D3_FUSAU|nr:hypothetical protein FAUST_9594 [Fusarium austroamericanum]
MQGHPLDNFIFTVGSTNRQGHSRLHTLSEFLTLPDSILTRHQDAKPIPIGRRYTFGRLRDAVKAELGDTGKGFEFIVLNAAQVAANIEGGKLDLASPSFEARLVPADREDRYPRQETPIAIHTVPSQKAKAKTPRVHNTTPREDQGKAAAKAVIATEDDDEDTDGILGFLRRKNLIKGDKVPGMLSEATIAQCAFMYELGRRLREETSMQGIYNADGVGYSKTFTTFMLLVLRRLASLTSQHLKEHPDQHIWSVENGGRCAFTQSIGIQCVCKKNSILEVLLDRLPESYSVVTAPIAVASVWEDHYIDFIEPTFIGVNFPFRGEPVLHAYNWHKKTSLRPLEQLPPCSLASFMRKERLEQAAPFAVFLSATPAIKDLSDLEMASSIINRQQGQHLRVIAALWLADRHSNDRDSAAYIDAIHAACRAVNKWMISRAGYSPMLDQGCRISALHLLPETITRTFDMPQELRRALGETIDKVRGGIVEHNVRVDPATFEHVIMSVKGADLMLKAGSVPGLQACVTADSNFPYSMGRVEEDIQAYNDVRRRCDSAYFQKLDLLTRNDPMFLAIANIVSQASQGKVANRPHHQVSSSPLHIILFTQHPCNAAAAYIYLREKCNRRADVVCLLSDTKPAARAKKLGELQRSSQGRRVDNSGKSIVVITTFCLGGFSLNDFIFCNLMIQLGEPQMQAGLIQAIGRVARRGQTKKTFRFYLKREGSESEELLRIRNERRTGVCHEQLGQMRLFQGLTLQ